MMEQTIFGIKICHYLVCAIGAFILFFKLAKKGQVIFEVIGYINPKWSESAWCRIFEAAIFTILGAFVGSILTQPTNPQQALAAGLGWTGLLSKIPQKEE